MATKRKNGTARISRIDPHLLAELRELAVAKSSFTPANLAILFGLLSSMAGGLVSYTRVQSGVQAVKDEQVDMKREQKELSNQVNAVAIGLAEVKGALAGTAKERK